MGWLRDLICGPCECAEPSPPRKVETAVPATSPARLLASSLTDPETRDEWERKYDSTPYALARHYKNKKRDLSISVGHSGGLYSSSPWLSTPFSLSKVEERVVLDAVAAFDRHKQDEREKAALARLTAQAGEAGTAGTATTGPSRRASTRSRSDAPKHK